MAFQSFNSLFKNKGDPGPGAYTVKEEPNKYKGVSIKSRSGSRTICSLFVSGMNWIFLFQTQSMQEADKSLGLATTKSLHPFPALASTRTPSSRTVEHRPFPTPKQKESCLRKSKTLLGLVTTTQSFQGKCSRLEATKTKGLMALLHLGRDQGTKPASRTPHVFFPLQKRISHLLMGLVLGSQCARAWDVHCSFGIRDLPSQRDHPWSYEWPGQEREHGEVQGRD